MMTQTQRTRWACGHDTEVERDLPWTGAPPVDENYVSQICPACLAILAGIPLINGTEKQQAFAASIRRDALKDLGTYRERSLRAAGPDREAEAKAYWKRVRKTLLAQTNSLWWIEHRYDAVRRIVTITPQVPAQ